MKKTKQWTLDPKQKQDFKSGKKSQKLFQDFVVLSVKAYIEGATRGEQVVDRVALERTQRRALVGNEARVGEEGGLHECALVVAGREAVGERLVDLDKAGLGAAAAELDGILQARLVAQTHRVERVGLRGGHSIEQRVVVAYLARVLATAGHLELVVKGASHANVARIGDGHLDALPLVGAVAVVVHGDEEAALDRRQIAGQRRVAREQLQVQTVAGQADRAQALVGRRIRRLAIVEHEAVHVVVQVEGREVRGVARLAVEEAADEYRVEIEAVARRQRRHVRAHFGLQVAEGGVHLIDHGRGVARRVDGRLRAGRAQERIELVHHLWLAGVERLQVADGHRRKCRRRLLHTVERHVHPVRQIGLYRQRCVYMYI